MNPFNYHVQVSHDNAKQRSADGAVSWVHGNHKRRGPWLQKNSEIVVRHKRMLRCINIHIYTHVCVTIYIFVWRNGIICICIYIYICMYIYASTCVYICLDILVSLMTSSKRTQNDMENTRDVSKEM